MPASISRRAFIQWPPEKPDEPTNTTVLTSPGARVIDIRLLKQSTDASTPAKQGLEPANIDWAFAGTSRSEWRSGVDQRTLTADELISYRPYASQSRHQDHVQKNGQVLHTIWTHTIDSRFENANEVQDEGDMMPLSSLGLTLEQGKMKNPSTGQLASYVEGWLDESIEDGQDHASSTCIVLELHDDTSVGLFIKLGSWMQGVARTSNKFALQQWHFQNEAWRLQASLTDFEFPYEAAQGEALSLGVDVKIIGAEGREWTWTVVESSKTKL